MSLTRPVKAGFIDIEENVDMCAGFIWFPMY